MKSDHLIDNSNDLNWFEDICKWADKYDLNHEDFPRDKTLLENMIQLEICDEEINEIPPQIEHLSKLLVLMTCHNNIKELPKELFNLKSLSMVSFPNNKISKIPNEIEYVNIFYLDISNNPIAELPLVIYKKKRLSALYFHNTNIDTIPEDICQLKNLTTLTFDDKHLSSISKYLYSFPNIDSINLAHSNCERTSKLIQNLGLKEDTQEWINKEDKKTNGVIKIFQETNFTPEDDMESMVEYGLSVVNEEPEKALRMYHEAMKLYEENNEEYSLPDKIIDLSIAIILNTAKSDIQYAINLLDILEIEEFRIETIDKLIAKTDDETFKRVLERIRK